MKKLNPNMGYQAFWCKAPAVPYFGTSGSDPGKTGMRTRRSSGSLDQVLVRLNSGMPEKEYGRLT